MSTTARIAFPSVSAIRAHALSKGCKWFERGAMRSFSTRLLRGVWASWDGKFYFVSSDARGPRALYGRGYSVRAYNPETNTVETVGEFNGHSTPKAARKAAQEAAAAAPAPK